MRSERAFGVKVSTMSKENSLLEGTGKHVLRPILR